MTATESSKLLEHLQGEAAAGHAAATAQRSATRGAKLLGIQYLRGFAAVAVVAYHAADKGNFNFLVGQAGVDIFFVLSGYLMWAITDARTQPGRFLLDRIRRIVPVYWIVTAVMIVGALLGLFPAMRLTLEHVLTSLLFIPAVSPSNGHIWPLVVPAWTLNYEMFFYSLFAVCLLLPRQRQMLMLSTVLIGAVAAGMVLNPSTTPLSYYSRPIVLEFLCGAWLAALQHRLPASTAISVCLLVASLAGFSLTGWSLDPDLHDPRHAYHGFSTLLYFGLPALLAVAGVIIAERKRPLPFLRGFVYLGDASYSIYLWQGLALSTLVKLAHLISLPPIATFLLCLIGSIAVGLACYAGIEKPLSRRLRPVRASPSATGQSLSSTR